MINRLSIFLVILFELSLTWAANDFIAISFFQAAWFPLALSVYLTCRGKDDIKSYVKTAFFSSLTIPWCVWVTTFHCGDLLNSLFYQFHWLMAALVMRGGVMVLLEQVLEAFNLETEQP
ncbi:MAG: hypothetical protein EOP04_02130 [Proteobacteria bacterium]|nr:MAG: hypothetical protein EOP04_02130 [Pseudomonadota bacterium]